VEWRGEKLTDAAAGGASSLSRARGDLSPSLPLLRGRRRREEAGEEIGARREAKQQCPNRERGERIMRAVSSLAATPCPQSAPAFLPFPDRWPLRRNDPACHSPNRVLCRARLPC
jgi:hypothetical protein